MPFLLLLVLMVACLPVRWPAPPAWVEGIGRSALGSAGIHNSQWEALVGSTLLTWAGVALVAGGAFLVTRRTCQQMQQQPDARDRHARRYLSARFYHLIGLFGVYGLSLYVLGWGWVVQGGQPEGEGLPDTIPGLELLTLAPFLTSLILSWAIFYGAERALNAPARLRAPDQSFWTRRTYVGFHIRNNLALVSIPVLLLILINDLPRLFPEAAQSNRVLLFGFSLAGSVAVFCGMPWIMRLVLGLRPLAEGPLRQRLLATARRLHFRCSNLMVWNTRGGVANAMVVGLLPLPRYVIFTDRLLSAMTPAEVEAVLGHEIGHIKHRHMPYYMAFLFASLAVLSALWDIAQLDTVFSLEDRKHLAALPLVGLLGTYVFVVFGFLSRRCERQADVYGCRAVSCSRADCAGHETDAAFLPGGRSLCSTGIRTFIDALEKVALLNGISRDRPGLLQSWQHSTIARRVEFLQRILRDRSVESKFQRRVGLMKWALFLSLALILFLVGRNWGWSNLLAF